MTDLRSSVAASLAEVPIIGVVRTQSYAQAEAIARQYIDAGLQLIEITFTVPEATELVRALRAERGDSTHWIGMGTVTTADRARQALAAGAEFVVSPNTTEAVAAPVRRGRQLPDPGRPEL